MDPICGDWCDGAFPSGPQCDAIGLPADLITNAGSIVNSITAGVTWGRTRASLNCKMALNEP